MSKQTVLSGGQKEDILDETINSILHKICNAIQDKPLLFSSIPNLIIYQKFIPTTPKTYMHEASVCLVFRGVKNVIIDDEVYIYDRHHYLLTSVDLPVLAQVIEASKESTCIGLKFTLDLQLASQLMLDKNISKPNNRTSKGISIGKVSMPLLKAFEHLIDLLDAPESIPFLEPLIHQEIIYHLLTSDQGIKLRQMCSSDGSCQQIAKAIEILKKDFVMHLNIDKLAGYAGMSKSTFHHHFKNLTSMSPLQYQKKLRLHEARRLMLVERMDAATASFNVGYESPTQFNREYARLFGAPPLTDIKSIINNK